MRIIYSLAVFTILLLFGCKTHQHLARLDANSREFSKEELLETDPNTEALIAPYLKEIRQKMSAVIGRNAEEMVKAQPESSLGNFCADAIYKKAVNISKTEIDFALQNYGGMRVPYLAGGDITRGRIYELMPFENRLVILELPGKATLQLIEQMTTRGGWPVSASLRYFIAENKPVEITVHGKPFDVNRTYKIALPDYIANGGDNCDFLLGHPRKDYEELIRDAFFDYIREHNSEGKPIHSKIDGRVAVLNH